MRKIFYCLIFALSFLGCEEIPPDVGSGSGSGGVEPGPEMVQRKIILEEFTGNRCVNCPAGSELIETLIDIHGDRLIPISLHCTQWAVPHENSNLDFRTQDAENIIQFLGFPAGFPTGVVSRKNFEGGFDLQLSADNWPGSIDEELLIEATASLGITPSFDPASRTASVEINTEFISPQLLEDDDQVMLTVYVLEDHVIDYQLTPDGDVFDYDHRHVFRLSMTPFSGEVIDLDGQPGGSVTKSYSTAIPDEWNVDNLLVVAFIHNSGSNKEIFQAEEIHLVD